MVILCRIYRFLYQGGSIITTLIQEHIDVKTLTCSINIWIPITMVDKNWVTIQEDDNFGFFAGLPEVSGKMSCPPGMVLMFQYECC